MCANKKKMSRWLEHTLPIGDLNDELWAQAYNKMLPKNWRVLLDDAKDPLDVVYRYQYGTFHMIGYSAFSVVFEGVREKGGQRVVLKMFRLPMFTGDQAKSAKSIARMTAAIAEVRALLYVEAQQTRRALAQPQRRNNIVQIVDYFRAVWSDDLRNHMVEFLLPRLAQHPSITKEEREQLQAGVVSDEGLDNIVAAFFPEMMQEETKPIFFIETLFGHGETLYNVMRDHEEAASLISPEVDLRLALEALRALEFLHDAGMAHGDISPENVFVNNILEAAEAPQAVSVVLLDLGAACRVGTDKRILGTCNVIGGRPQFDAPTILALNAQQPAPPDAASIPFEQRASWDVYALGLTLYDWGHGDFLPGTLTADEFNAQTADERAKLARQNVFSRLPVAPYFPPAPADDAAGTLNTVIGRMLEFDDAVRVSAKEAADFVEQRLAAFLRNRAAAAATAASSTTTKRRREAGDDAGDSERRKTNE